MWFTHVAKTINKAHKALHAIRLIKTYFTYFEILQLLTSNFYLILYYNSEIWHLPTLKDDLKQHLLSVSAKALKISLTNPDPMESFVNIHQICKQALPNQILEYKHAIIFYKLYNVQIHQMDWIELNFNQTLMSRETYLIKINQTTQKQHSFNKTNSP